MLCLTQLSILVCIYKTMASVTYVIEVLLLLFVASKIFLSLSTTVFYI